MADRLYQLLFELMAESEQAAAKRIGPPLPASKPVQLVNCFMCRGSGWVETNIDSTGIGHGRECGYCNGRGTVATEGGEA